MKKPLLAFLAFLLVLSACKKADEPVSPDEKLRGAAWHRTSFKMSYTVLPAGNDTVIDLIDQVPGCVRDNSLLFNTNHEGTEQRGGDLCSAGDPDNVPFFWEMLNAGSNLHIYNADETFLGNASVNADILTLTANALTFRYRQTIQDPNTPNVNTVITYTEVFRR